MFPNSSLEGRIKKIEETGFLSRLKSKIKNTKTGLTTFGVGLGVYALAQLFSLGALVMAAEVEQEGIAQEKIPAIRLEESAVIDGVLDDDVWKRAFYDKRVYRDQTSGETEPFQDEPTETWVYYNDEGLFIAFRCFDKDIICQDLPAKSNRDVGRGANETVGFAFSPDLNGHKDEKAQYQYSMTPTGAYHWKPAVGRATKKELFGEPKGVATVHKEEGYWEGEMVLRWKSVNYPLSDEPYDMLLCLQRRHVMPDTGARLAFYPETYTKTDTRLHFNRFTGFVAPPWKAQKTIVPNFHFGWNEEGGVEQQFGIDGSWRPTPESNFTGTYNPYFGDDAWATQRIDPSYDPRIVGDPRIFFQEGSALLPTPWNFYSPNIREFILGGSAFGNYKGISFASLATVNGGEDQKLALRGFKDWSGHHLGGAYFSDRSSHNHVLWGDYGTKWNWGKNVESKVNGTKTAESKNTDGGTKDSTDTGGKFTSEFLADVGQSFVGGEDTGRKWWCMGSLRTQDQEMQLQLTTIDPNYRNDLGFPLQTGIYGSQLMYVKQKIWSEGKMFYELRTTVDVKNHYGGAIHRRTIDSYLWHNRKAINAFYFGVEGGQYDENRDLLFSLMYWRNYKDRQNYFRSVYTVGRRAGETLNQFDISFAFPCERLHPDFSAQFLLYDDPNNPDDDKFKKQVVVSADYDVTDNFGFGGRLVVNNKGKSGYLEMHRSGVKGTEFSVFFGNPNSQQFEKRISVNLVGAFELEQLGDWLKNPPLLLHPQ